MFTVIYSIFFITKSLFPDSKYISTYQCIFLSCVFPYQAVLLKHLLELYSDATAECVQTAEPGNE